MPQPFKTIPPSEYNLPTQKLVEEIIALDYEVFPDIQEDQEGSLALWTQKWRDHPNCSRILTNEENHICGYWSVAALKKDAFQEILRGHLMDGELCTQKMTPLNKKGHYKLYFITICIKKEYRTPKAFQTLLNSFFEFLHELAEKEVFIEEICANAFSPKGITLCKKLGMKEVCHHKDKGTIFHISHFQSRLPLKTRFSAVW